MSLGEQKWLRCGWHVKTWCKMIFKEIQGSWQLFHHCFVFFPLRLSSFYYRPNPRSRCSPLLSLPTLLSVFLLHPNDSLVHLITFPWVCNLFLCLHSVTHVQWLLSLLISAQFIKKTMRLGDTWSELTTPVLEHWDIYHWETKERVFASRPQVQELVYSTVFNESPPPCSMSARLLTRC